MYQVVNKGSVVKEYPYKIQAVVWCFLHGFITTGYGYYFLNPDIEIRKVLK